MPAAGARPLSASRILIAFLAAAFAVAAATLPPSDPDLFWHLSSGDWMLDHRALLDVDVFSFTRVGTHYSVGQWLGEIVLALAFRAFGWVGIDLVRAAVVGVATIFLSRAVLRAQPHPGWAAAPLLAALLVSKTLLGDRPQIFTLALFPVFLDVLLATRADGRTRRLLALPPLMLVWANLHGAFVLGLVLIAIFLLESLLTPVRALRRPLSLTLGAATLLSLATPSGLGAFAFAGGYASSPGRYIVEDLPPDVLGGAGFVFAALLLASLGIAFALGRDGVRARVGSPLLWAGLIVPFTLVGLSSQRELPYAAMVAAPFVAAGSSAALRRPVAAEAPRVGRRAGIAAIVAILAVMHPLLLVVAARQPDLAAYPVGAPTLLAGARGNLLNEYDWGGYLIRFAPDAPTFVDGRGAVLFAPAVLGDLQRMIALRPGYRETLERYAIRFALLRPERALAVALRADGWAVRGEQAGRWILLQRP